MDAYESSDSEIDDGLDSPKLKVGEEAEIGDLGLKKKLFGEGEGWSTPVIGDEVRVNYAVGLPDGTNFESSRAKGGPYKFKIGKCYTIKGLDEGTKTMKKGEKAIFTVPPELAYHDVPPSCIAHNATIKLHIQLLSWSTDICKDGGIIKKILNDGKERKHPNDLDEVFVKYEARLEDGTVIAKSEGAEFVVKDGYLCPALAKAVKTMTKGQRVLLTVKPQYGFGEKRRPALGNVGVVPRNTTLHVDLELVSWKKVREIGDGGKVLKKILKEGKGHERPDYGAVVKVKLIGKLQDGTVFVKKGHDEEELFAWKTDEEQVIEGLERAVMTMKEGEVALVTIPQEHAFSSTVPKPDFLVVPPNSTVVYEVELVSIVGGKIPSAMNTAEKIEAADKKKEEGNALFERGSYAKALKKYEKGISFVKRYKASSEEQKEQIKLLKVTINLYIAACQLNLNDYKEAERFCTKVLELETGNVKALHCRAQAYIHLLDLDLAKRDLKEALEIDPDNRNVKLEYETLKEKMKEYHT